MTYLPNILLAAGGEMDPDSTQALQVFGATALVVTLGLLATTRHAYRWQRIPAVGAMMSGGWVAIALGALLGPHVLHVIDGEVLLNVRPLLMIGLGWVGVIVGMQGQSELLKRVPRVLWKWTLSDAVLSILFTGAIAMVAMSFWLPVQYRTAAWALGPALAMAACMVGWSPETRSIRVVHTPEANRLAVLVESGAGLSAMLAIGLFGLTFGLTGRDETGQMRFFLARAAVEILIAIVVAILLGFGGRFMLRRADRSRPDMLAVFLGLVAISAGVAADLWFSVLLGSMMVGVVVANLAGPRLRDFERFIMGAEHAVALMFFLLAGVLLDPTIGPWGTILVIMLVVVRLAVKPLAMARSVAAYAGELPLRSALYAAPVRQSPVAIAIAVGLVLSEASMFNRRLLTIIALVGLFSELLPFLASIALRRQVRMQELPAEGGPC